MEKPINYPAQPAHLWDQFFNITQVPRPSKKEGKIREYLINLAKSQNLKWVEDSVQNIVIYVPGKNGRENEEPIIIQNHMDMVTDATSDRAIDFENDPIKTYVKDGWLRADRTTLGADNGIGCAAALALIFEKDVVHPPLELLFTVDEETGLNGALGLEAKYLKGKKMLNLDTEEWGSVYVGCAGGIDYEFNAEIDYEEPNQNYSFYDLGVKGLVGGHSGVDIHEQRANAIKILTDILYEFPMDEYELGDIVGGRAHNIIPREASAVIGFKKENEEHFKEILNNLKERYSGYFNQEDQNIVLSLTKRDAPSKVLDQETKYQILNFLTLFPHGAHKFSNVAGKKLVSMSNNLAKVIAKNGAFYVQSSLRFFDRNEVIELEKKMLALAGTFGLDVHKNSEYPSWKPASNNKVLDTVTKVYRETFNKEANITAIHAGLECGILRDKIGPIDVVSFGPTIMGAHSPDERVEISTVDTFWLLLTNVLKEI